LWLERHGPTEIRRRGIDHRSEPDVVERFEDELETTDGSGLREWTTALEGKKVWSIQSLSLFANLEFALSRCLRRREWAASA
jgi:hypothetical protein